MTMPLKRSTRQRLARVLAAVFFIAVIAMLTLAARQLDWPQIVRAIHAYDTRTLAAALMFVLAGYSACACYDLLGRAYEAHDMPIARTLAAGFVAYAFTINLTSLVGSWGSRLRLYSRFDLKPARIVRVICVCIISNWLGFMLLVGALFLLHPPALPESWPLHGATLRGLGAGSLIIVGAYLLACGAAHEHSWSVRGVTLHAPSLRFAALQLAASCISWSMAAAVIDRLLPPEIPYFTAMGVLFVSSIAGLMLRLPAGAGVIEGVFVAVFGNQWGASVVLAAVLTYRAVYYLLPLAAALLVYAVLEIKARAAHRQQALAEPLPLHLRL